VYHYFTAYKGFKREGSEHIEAKTETGDIDHNAVFGEIVENVSLGEGTESEKAGKGH